MVLNLIVIVESFFIMRIHIFYITPPPEEKILMIEQQDVFISNLFKPDICCHHLVLLILADETETGRQTWRGRQAERANMS